MLVTPQSFRNVDYNELLRCKILQFGPDEQCFTFMLYDYYSGYT